MIELVADRGVVVAAEVREPAPTLKGVGAALGGLLSGKAPGPEALIPDAQLFVIVPDVGDRAEVLFAAIRLAFRAGEHKVAPFAASGRTGFRLALGGEGGLPLPIHAAWWAEEVAFFDTRHNRAWIMGEGEARGSAKRIGHLVLMNSLFAVSPKATCSGRS